MTAIFNENPKSMRSITLQIISLFIDYIINLSKLKLSYIYNQNNVTLRNGTSLNIDFLNYILHFTTA